jgi:hypothetical protein
MKTLAQNDGDLGLTDLVGSVSGYKTIAPWELGIAAPKDGTYKLSSMAGVFVSLSTTLQSGSIYLNSSRGTISVKGLTGSINATMISGVDAKKKIDLVGSFSCKR